MTGLEQSARVVRIVQKGKTVWEKFKSMDRSRKKDLIIVVALLTIWALFGVWVVGCKENFYYTGTCGTRLFYPCEEHLDAHIRAFDHPDALPELPNDRKNWDDAEELRLRRVFGRVLSDYEPRVWVVYDPVKPAKPAKPVEPVEPEEPVVPVWGEEDGGDIIPLQREAASASLSVVRRVLRRMQMQNDVRVIDLDMGSFEEYRKKVAEEVLQRRLQQLRPLPDSYSFRVSSWLQESIGCKKPFSCEWGGYRCRVPLSNAFPRRNKGSPVVILIEGIERVARVVGDRGSFRFAISDVADDIAIRWNFAMIVTTSDANLYAEMLKWGIEDAQNAATDEHAGFADGDGDGEGVCSRRAVRLIDAMPGMPTPPPKPKRVYWDDDNADEEEEEEEKKEEKKLDVVTE